MKALTFEESNDWLASVGVKHDPFREKAKGAQYYLTGALTDVSRSVSFAFVRNLLVYGLMPSGDVLLRISDWSLYQKDEMSVIDSFRSSFGECRSLNEANGHLFASAEMDHCVGLFNLTFAYGWSSYLYIFNPSLTFFNWEGEMFEFWSEQKDPIILVQKYCQKHNLPKRKNA
jgi:hypothetical protein